MGFQFLISKFFYYLKIERKELFFSSSQKLAAVQLLQILEIWIHYFHFFIKLIMKDIKAHLNIVMLTVTFHQKIVLRNCP